MSEDAAGSCRRRRDRSRLPAPRHRRLQSEVGLGDDPPDRVDGLTEKGQGGCRRQVDGTTGLPSAPEMPCAPTQLRLVPGKQTSSAAGMFLLIASTIKYAGPSPPSGFASVTN